MKAGPYFNKNRLKSYTFLPRPKLMPDYAKNQGLLRCNSSLGCLQLSLTFLSRLSPLLVPSSSVSLPFGSVLSLDFPKRRSALRGTGACFSLQRFSLAPRNDFRGRGEMSGDDGGAISKSGVIPGLNSIRISGRQESEGASSRSLALFLHPSSLRLQTRGSFVISDIVFVDLFENLSSSSVFGEG